MPCITIEDRFFIDPNRVGVFPDEITRINGRWKTIKILPFHRFKIDEADPRHFKNVMERETAGLAFGRQILNRLLWSSRLFRWMIFLLFHGALSCLTHV